MNNCLAPSLLAADMLNMEACVRAIDEAGAHYIHVDVMDGIFVPPITFGDNLVKAIRPITDKVIDVHLMVENPNLQIERFVKAGADIISVHAESCLHLDRTINAIKDNDVMACVALNPATPVSVIKHVLPLLDMVLIMSVNSGFGGQRFIDYTLNKVTEVYELIKSMGLSTDIEVDGGVTLSNAKRILDAGANVLVAGTAVFKGNVTDNVNSFLDIMQ